MFIKSLFSHSETWFILPSKDVTLQDALYSVFTYSSAGQTFTPAQVPHSTIILLQNYFLAGVQFTSFLARQGAQPT